MQFDTFLAEQNFFKLYKIGEYTKRQNEIKFYEIKFGGQLMAKYPPY
jgi:hypothetical protein